MEASMLRIVLGLALVLGLTAAPARAADFPRNTSPYVAAPYAYGWGGFYVGLNLGYQWGSITNSNFEHSGFAGGVQAGYNWQAGSFVFGAETDLQLSGADDTIGPAKVSNPWFGR